MAISTYTVNLLFPVVLAIHNADEFLRYEQFIQVYHSRIAPRFVTRKSIGYAALLITIAATVLSVFTWLYENAILMKMSAIAVFALLLNAAGHVIMSIRRGSLTPGTFTAITLVIPYSLAMIFLLHADLGMSWTTMANLAALGLLAAPLAIVTFIFLGYLMSYAVNAQGPR